MTTSKRDPLPTDEQRRQLGQMMATAFQELRMLAKLGGSAARIEELAEDFHNLPTEIYGQGKWNPRLFRLSLQEYERRYAGDAPWRPHNYVAAFDHIFGPAADHDRSADG